MAVPLPALALTSVLGLVVGSFLNVVAHRLPLGVSLSRPGSRCPACRTPIRARDNVPVLAWLWRRGRCASCATPIPARYPLVEAGTAVLWLVAVLAARSPVEAVLYLLLVTALVPLVLIDLEHRLLPNRITGPTAVAAVALGLLLDPGGQHLRLLAGLGGLLALGLPALVRPGGMGMGDVKLAAVMGLCLGPVLVVALFAALLSGALVGLALAARSDEGRKLAVPFGPFLALGALVAIVAGDPLLDAYLRLW